MFIKILKTEYIPLFINPLYKSYQKEAIMKGYQDWPTLVFVAIHSSPFFLYLMFLLPVY